MADSEDLLAMLLQRLPVTPDRVVMLYPDRDNPKTLAMSFFGMTYEELAEALYATADKVVDQKIPPPDWRERLSKPR